MRDLIDPPWQRQVREQQQRMRDLIDPPWQRQMREQQQRMRDLADPPWQRQMREQQQRMRDLIDPPWQRQMREQQARLTALLQTPALRTITSRTDHWSEALTPEVLEDIERYETSIAGRVVAAESGESDQTYGQEGEAWFGAAAWSVLLREIEGLLKALEVLTAGLTAANMEIQAPPTACQSSPF